MELDASALHALVNDPIALRSKLYCSLTDAIEALKQRETNRDLELATIDLLGATIPKSLTHAKGLVLFRNVATPNYEAHRLKNICEKLSGFQPIIFELTDDKFADVNPSKRALAKLRFLAKANGHTVFRNHSAIETGEANGKQLRTLKSQRGFSLVDSHREFFKGVFGSFFVVEDISEWLHSRGNRPHEYYVPFLSLFLQNAILFENFLNTEQERSFCRDVVLPAFCAIELKTGHRPLIVPLEPFDSEGDSYWTSYPDETANFWRF